MFLGQAILPVEQQHGVRASGNVATDLVDVTLQASVSAKGSASGAPTLRAGQMAEQIGVPERTILEQSGHSKRDPIRRAGVLACDPSSSSWIMIQRQAKRGLDPRNMGQEHINAVGSKAATKMCAVGRTNNAVSRAETMSLQALSFSQVISSSLPSSSG